MSAQSVAIPLRLIVVPTPLDPEALAAAADAVERSYDEDDNPRQGEMDFIAERAIAAYLTHLAAREGHDVA